MNTSIAQPAVARTRYELVDPADAALTARPHEPAADAIGRWREHLRRGRPSRMVVLLTGIVVFSAADLYLTVLYMTTVGMGEANPLARQLVQSGGVAPIALLKLATVSVAVSALWACRRRAIGEIGAVIGCVMLIWVMTQWTGYARNMTEATMMLPLMGELHAGDWVYAGQ